MWKGDDYTGDSHTIRGPSEVYNNGYWNQNNNYAPGPDSFKCRCQQKKVDCQPTDGYDPILWCDGTDAVVDTTCSYKKIVGTKFSSQMSKEFSISKAVEAELTME